MSYELIAKKQFLACPQLTTTEIKSVAAIIIIIIKYKIAKTKKNYQWDVTTLESLANSPRCNDAMSQSFFQVQIDL